MRNKTPDFDLNTMPDADMEDENSPANQVVTGLVILLVFGSFFGLENGVELTDGLSKFAKAGILTVVVLVGVAIQSMTRRKSEDARTDKSGD
jgi:hypothetical protein